MCKGLQVAIYKKRRAKKQTNLLRFFSLTSNQISFPGPHFTGEWIETTVFKVFLVD